MTPAIAVLERELAWINAVIEAGVGLFFGTSRTVEEVRAIAPPTYTRASGATRLLSPLRFEERVVLGLALTHHLRPHALDVFLMRNPHTERRFSEFGGCASGEGAFRPTLETAAFLLAGDRLERRLALLDLVAREGPLRAGGMLQEAEPAPGGNPFDVPLRVDPSCLAALTGRTVGAFLSLPVPVQRIETPLAWSDLVVSRTTHDDLAEIEAWLQHRDWLAADGRLGRHAKPGFRALFHGPPGTGKTLAAMLIGKQAGLDVLRVDLACIASKWVGETEKNLAEVFAFAERRQCILFFDEADAIFGKRSSGGSGQERYANLEVSYLLQRIEEFGGLAILASNLKGNIDEAFARRFQSMVYFALPDAAQRLRLWRALFPDTSRWAGSIDLARVAADYELTGSTIANVARYAVLMSRRDGSDRIAVHHIHDGVRREYRKLGRSLPGASP